MLYLYDMAGVRSSHSTGVGGNPPADAEYTNNVDPTSDDDDDDDEWGNGGWRPRRVYRGRDVEETSLRRIKAEQGEIGSWTVTDAHADRTGNRMIYSSITPWVHMMSTSDDGTQHVPLKFGSHNDGYGVSGLTRKPVLRRRFGVSASRPTARKLSLGHQMVLSWCTTLRRSGGPSGLSGTGLT
jgi:hypothetical protein